ncbi:MULTISPECIES: ATP-binding protein [Microbulbifer]|uniref:ATP-binding protein n=1 Tax=Microbulbifer TaxID=48073 RepID=UPI002414383B|nr:MULTISPECIES: ATP-binding protein [Microbulbifer]
MSQLDLTTAQYRSLQNLLAEAESQELSYLVFAQRLAEKPLESFDYRRQTSMTKRQANALLDFGFIDQRENLVFIGSPGAGKTHLAIGSGQKAV